MIEEDVDDWIAYCGRSNSWPGPSPRIGLAKSPSQNERPKYKLTTIPPQLVAINKTSQHTQIKPQQRLQQVNTINYPSTLIHYQTRCCANSSTRPATRVVDWTQLDLIDRVW